MFENFTKSVNAPMANLKQRPTRDIKNALLEAGNENVATLDAQVKEIQEQARLEAKKLRQLTFLAGATLIIETNFVEVDGTKWDVTKEEKIDRVRVLFNMSNPGETVTHDAQAGFYDAVCEKIAELEE